MPRPYNHVHFVGVGGIGMLALAQYMIAKRVSISGSDLHDSHAFEALRGTGATISIGHDEQNISDSDLVVMTSAAAQQNPEVIEARRRGIPIMKRAELLGELTNTKRSIAIAGTHGKTTTTALCGHLLRTSGADVSIFGGGFIRGSDQKVHGPAIIGSDPGFVIEADEYDRSFLQLRPTLAVISNIDFDHPDCYPTIGDMVDAYTQFARQVEQRLIVADVSTWARQAVDSSGKSYETYGLGGDSEWRGENITQSGLSSSFRVFHGNVLQGEFLLNLPGHHNVINAIAALIAAARYSNRPVSDFADGLASFRGVARRLELRGRVDGVSVVDDYAHHPAEILAAVDALGTAQGRLRVVFQPHTYSRTEALLDEFVEALARADEVVLLDIFAAREAPIPGVTSVLIQDRLRMRGVNSHYFIKHTEAVEYISETAQSGDLIVTMGAGDVTQLADSILNRLDTLRQPASALGSQSNGAHPNAASRDSLPKSSSCHGLIEALAEAGLIRIRQNEPMSRHTSWRVGGPADVFAVATTPEALGNAFLTAASFHVPCLVLGGGSNVLVSDAGIEGLVISNRIRDMRLDTSSQNTCIETGSGVFFARLALYAADEGFTGLEWGVAIPGTVGAGVVNNSGAHFGDVERSLVQAEVIDVKGRSTLRPEQLGFRYRESILKSNDGLPITHTNLAVSRCWFAVEPDRANRSREMIEELMAHRRATQPVSESSGGSTFANPPHCSAGRLIEEAGLKGTSRGGASFSEKHANFIVTKGAAHASDIVELIHLAQGTVKNLFDEDLRPEVQFVGRWDYVDLPLAPPA